MSSSFDTRRNAHNAAHPAERPSRRPGRSLRRATPVLFVGAILAGALPLGCESEPEVEPPTAETFGALVAETLCAPALECCHAAGLSDSNVEACVYWTEKYWGRWKEAAEDAGVPFSPTNALAFLELAKKGLCGMDSDAEWQALRKAELHVYGGTKAVGEACNFLECAPPSEEGMDSYCSSEHVCTLLQAGRFVGEGEACDIPSPGTPPGVVEGRTCDYANGLSCSPFTGKCEPFPELGESCSSSNDGCMGGRCDAFHGVCIAAEPVGALCGWDQPGNPKCAAPAHCTTPDFGAGTCEAPIPLGSSCRQLDGHLGYDAWCDGGGEVARCTELGCIRGREAVFLEFCHENVPVE